MKVIFERKKEPEDLPVPEPGEAEFKPHSEKKVISIRSNPESNIKPPVPVQVQDPDVVEKFKQEYMGVFGMDSITASSSEVLMLNLLFAIYSELVGLRNDLTEGE